jgi:CHAT domain-containing protein
VDIRTYPLGIKLDKVIEWASEFLPLSLATHQSQDCLKKLERLVTPLAESTHEGELLVFCPTQILHLIPLHALHVDNKILIRRNPILYCHSLSILRYCFLSAQRQQEAPQNEAPAGVALFADPQLSDFMTHGRGVATELGHRFKVPAAIGRMATKERFVEQCATNTLIHFHGHCEFERRDSLQHRIKLHNPEEE